MRRTAELLIVLPSAALVIVGVRAFAEGTSGTVRLRGFVPQVCSVSVQDRGVVLELGGVAQSRTVAAIEERCNAPSGYTVTLSSRNGGELRPELAGGAGLPYTMAYDGAVPTAQGTVAASRPPGVDVNDLAVATQPSGNLEAGAYADIITVTVQAK